MNVDALIQLCTQAMLLCMYVSMPIVLVGALVVAQLVDDLHHPHRILCRRAAVDEAVHARLTAAVPC